MRKPIVAGNWKMNKTVAEARRLVHELLTDLEVINQVERVLAPPFTALAPLAEMLAGSAVGLGAQNLHWEAGGAYTGEIAPAMVAELCQYVILGHSERRAYFGETDETVNLKVKAALANGLTPIVCIGETLAENESGQTEAVLSRQLRAGLEGLDPGAGEKLVLAYEPVWAIGTGKACDKEIANSIIRDVVRGGLIAEFGEQIGQGIRILYGGSVKPENAVSYFQMSDIDGALVGGASLKAADFIQIVRAAA
jgi:triosephosphate isomerase